MLWIKEVETVYARIASSFNKIIPSSRRRSVWRDRKLRKRIDVFEEDRSLT